MISNPSRHTGVLRYVLDIFVQLEQKDWRPCRMTAGHHAFRLLHVDEWCQIQKLEEPPKPPHVVPYVPPAANAA
ncbi:hypothetical protein TRAPUB_14205 [Trametes pubescens]|uniref:Uncharacterized protein n=1 Tax=Trametes pubescens TaxID=154538 RepID=A0A1M2VP85_TRAPU|nr:hypothetical protein TRAPUB_14205 [Trametes pubescens]